MPFGTLENPSEPDIKQNMQASIFKGPSELDTKQNMQASIFKGQGAKGKASCKG
ncbi:MAG: hypothetical protein Phog2KO_49650 [Phototrophicaceae bacterium]